MIATPVNLYVGILFLILRQLGTQFSNQNGNELLALAIRMMDSYEEGSRIEDFNREKEPSSRRVVGPI
jgi:hypothetical protein